MTIKEYFTLTETSVYLGVSRRTLYGWVENKRIPFYRVGGKKITCRVGKARKEIELMRGGKILFSKADIDAWMAAQRVAPEEEGGTNE
jgi:excisionase family DNA binding protein